jgi:hypothetical protein
MKKLIAASLTVVAVLCTPAAFGDVAPGRVLGESLDSGLGNLASTYTAEEFLKRPAGHIAGEKLDSGLGSLSQEEVRRIVADYQRR